MNRDDDLRRKIEEQLDGLGRSEHRRLKKHAEVCLRRYCKAEKPRLGETAKLYIECAKDGLRRDAVAYAERHPGKTVIELLELMIEELVERKELITKALVDDISKEERAKTWKAVTAWAIDKYGGREFAGTSVEDHLSDAYVQAFNRERHLPACRDITLIAFLIQSLRSNVDHLLKKEATLPRHVSIVSTRKEDWASATCTEEELPDNRADEERDAMEKAERFFCSIKDAELQRYARFRATGEHYSAKESAEALGWTEKKVRSIHRRLLRFRLQWYSPKPKKAA
jgi:hypothetical protein